MDINLAKCWSRRTQNSLWGAMHAAKGGRVRPGRPLCTLSQGRLKISWRVSRLVSEEVDRKACSPLPLCFGFGQTRTRDGLTRVQSSALNQGEMGVGRDDRRQLQPGRVKKGRVVGL